MSNLIPEVRVNKLGVPVTKHVLPPSAGATPKTAIPSPALAQDNWGETKGMVAEYLHDRTDSPDDIMWRLSSLDPVLRRQVTDALLSGDDYLSPIALKTMEHCKENQIPYIIGTLSFHRALHLATFRDERNEGYRQIVERSAFSSLKNRFSFEFFGQPQGEATPERLDFFKADVIDDYFDFRHAYPVNFEKHAALQELVKDIDRVEAALPAMAQVKTGMRHWRQENRTSTDAPYLLVPDLLDIARIVDEQPESAGHFYQYARMRGSFDASDFMNMVSTESPALYNGVL